MSAKGKKDYDDDSIDDDELMNLGNDTGKVNSLVDKKGSASLNANFSES
jgi:hypothetical protein